MTRIQQPLMETQSIFTAPLADVLDLLEYVQHGRCNTALGTAQDPAGRFCSDLLVFLKEIVMKLKVYFDVYPWSNQENTFFWGNIPTQPVINGKRYVAEIEVPDPDSYMEVATVNSVAEN